MKVNYQVSEEEAIDAWTRIGFNRRQKVFTLGVTVVCILLSGIALLSGMRTIGIALIITGILVPCFRWLSYTQACKKNYRGAPFMKDTVTATFSDTGTRMTYTTTESETKWEGYIGYFEFDEVFVLMQSNVLNRIVPKRAFSSEQLRSLEQILRQHLPRLR